MMSARLLRGDDGRHGHGHASDRARGFYRHIDARLHRAARAGRCGIAAIVVGRRRRWSRSRRSRSTAWSSRNTSRPTSTKPSSRSASTRPRAPASPRWTTRCGAIENDLRAIRGVRTVLAYGGRELPRQREPGAASTSASRRTRSGCSRSAGCSRRRCSGKPLEAFRATTRQRDVMQEVRRRLQQVPGPARRPSATSRPSTSAAATVRHRLRRCAGRTSRRWPSTPSSCARRRPSSGLIDADTTLKLDKPELRVEIDRERAADLGVDTAGHRHGAAPDGRRRRRGLALPRRDDQRRLRRAAAPERGRSQRSRHDRAALRARARAAAWCVSTTWCTIDADHEPVAHRSAGPPAPGAACAATSRPATRWPTASPRCAGAATEMNLPPATPRRVAGRGARTGDDVQRVPVGVPAVGHLHVHDPGVAVREPRPPVHDPAVAAAGRAVRAAVALG